MGTSKVSETQIFAGGLNLVPSSHLLGEHESRYLAGVNVRRGNLFPFKSPLTVEPLMAIICIIIMESIIIIMYIGVMCYTTEYGIGHLS